MEADGALSIFERSKDLYDCQYTKYLGCGDSNAYTTVRNNNPYNTDIAELECTGHVQKGMGTALTNVLPESKAKKFVVNSSGIQLRNKTAANQSCGEKMYSDIGGDGRLTKKAILKIQGHYGAAVRDNSTIEDMESVIWVIYHHRSGNHTRCADWCASHNGDMEKHISTHFHHSSVM